MFARIAHTLYTCIHSQLYSGLEVPAAKALVRLHECAGLSEPWLLARMRKYQNLVMRNISAELLA